MRHGSRWLIALLALWLAAAAHAQTQAPPRMRVNARLTVQLADRDAAAAALIARAEALGGYFSEASDRAVTLKVPAAQARALIEQVKSQWTPVEESYRSTDVQGQIDEVGARLKAKQELYERMQAMLDGAEARDIVAVEAAATRLIREIELLKGRLRVLQHALDYATVTVGFELQQRRRPTGEASPFGWLNDLGLDALLTEFER